MEKQQSPTRYQAINLRAVLQAQGRKKEWLANEAGISPSLVTMLLSGKRTVSEEVAERIARAVGVPLFLIFELPISRVSHLNGRSHESAA